MSNTAPVDVLDAQHPIDEEPNGLGAMIRALPAWARWSLAATLGILVLTIVQEISGTSLLTSEGTSSAMLRWSIPILLAGLGGLFSERSGVVNIGLEGMMILGTWCGAWGALEFGSPWWGLVTGFVGGALGGLLHAIATVNFGVDQIVSGVAINILAPGLARYLSERVFGGMQGGSVSQSPRVRSAGDFTVPVVSDLLDTIRDWNVFFISDIAGFLRGFVTDMRWFTLIALLVVPLSAFILGRTRFGLRVRICGENPSAGESLGINVIRHKYIAVMISGALAGLAGAYIVIELSGLYRGGQTVGRGFIGLAALIFGNWRALGILMGSLLFSYPFGLALIDFDAQGSGVATRALLLVIAIGLFTTAVVLWRGSNQHEPPELDAADLDTPTGSYMRMMQTLGGSSGGLTVLAAVLGMIALVWYLSIDAAASWLPNTMPYVLVLLVLVFAAQRLRPPKAAGQPFRRGDH
ncbi:MAG: ABC transporter permease [Ilumatobacteraceae bacterium]|nr:ABC transporter permease [Ilumatobacteraceae bacterium]